MCSCRLAFDLHASLVPAEEIFAVGARVGHAVERLDAAGDAGAGPEPETGNGKRETINVVRRDKRHKSNKRDKGSYPTTHKMPAKIHAMGPASDSVLV